MCLVTRRRAGVDDATLQADRSKLLTIFENLFRNAVEHGSTSPPSTSSQEDAIDHCQPGVAVDVGATDDGFYVQDDGPGIPPDHRDHVFEYGYTTGTEGTGLGLSIVRTMGRVPRLDREARRGGRWRPVRGLDGDRDGADGAGSVTDRIQTDRSEPGHGSGSRHSTSPVLPNRYPPKPDIHTSSG